jgi:hypothetical protein
MGTISGPFSIPDGLIYHIDPANPKSYIGAGTTIYDLSGNGNTSNFTNGAFYQNYQKGVVVVDGFNDYISTPLFNISSAVSVSVWIKNVALDSIVFGASGSGVNYANSEYIFYYYSNTALRIQGNNAGPFKEYYFSNINLNTWHNLVMTRDASNNMRVYFNGIGSTTGALSYSGTMQMNQIGRYSTFNNIYNAKGSIGEVKIYNRALSASEVLQNYNASKKRYLPEENIVTNGLIFNLDAANPSSYVGSGNTSYDLSGFGNTATLVNGTGFGVTGGGMFVFDGSNDYITLGDKLDMGMSNYSFSCWVNLSSVSGTRTIFSKSVADYQPYRYALLLINNKLRPFMRGNLNDSDVEFDSTLSLASATWYHTTVVYERSSTMKLYINGTLDSSASISHWQNLDIQNSYTFKIASYADPNDSASYFMQGSISNFVAYNRALTAQEISQNYNATKSRYNI